MNIFLSLEVRDCRVDALLRDGTALGERDDDDDDEKKNRKMHDQMITDLLKFYVEICEIRAQRCW